MTLTLDTIWLMLPRAMATLQSYSLSAAAMCKLGPSSQCCAAAPDPDADDDDDFVGAEGRRTEPSKS